MSHPVWVRGLKLLILGCLLLLMVSHPVWVRGLKPLLAYQKVYNDFVAPRVGAWIETGCKVFDKMLVEVAPRVGAWIETSVPSCESKSAEVAPRVGAWIETNFPLFRPPNPRCRTPCGCVD